MSGLEQQWHYERGNEKQCVIDEICSSRHRRGERTCGTKMMCLGGPMHHQGVGPPKRRPDGERQELEQPNPAYAN